MIKRHLVFHFYVPKEYKGNVAIRMHLECLKMYSSLFDSAVFSLCFEDDDKSLAIEVEKDIMDCGFVKDVRFIIEDNTLLTESVTFKNHVIDHLDELDGMVFFGHTKGVTNVKNENYNIENIKKWIFSLYFYSFEFIDEAEKILFYPQPWQATFFGPLKTTYDGGNTFHYPGTFFWLNPSMLYNDIRSGFVEIPKLANRTYAEDMPFIYKESDTCHRVACHNGLSSHHLGLYNVNFDSVIRFFGDYEYFMIKYNEIIEKIK